MDDKSIVAEIGRLTDEEHRIERSHVGVAWTAEERRRSDELEVLLDQCWDLLAQRRARRNAGQDPDAATTRPASVGEHFQQ